METTKYPPLKNDLLLRAARNEPVPRPPIWVMRQAGRYLPQYHREKNNRDFFQCVRDPEVASNLTLQPIDEYDGLIDAAIIFSDILVVPQALGMEVKMEEGRGPVFVDRLVTPEDEQYGRILGKEVDVQAELGYVYDAISVTREKLRGRVPLFGFCGAPWTLLCYMVEGGGSKTFKDIKRWIYKWPEESKKLLVKLTDVCVEHLAKQVLAGAQVRTSDSVLVIVTSAVCEIMAYVVLFRLCKSSTHGRGSYPRRHSLSSLSLTSCKLLKSCRPVSHR